MAKVDYIAEKNIKEPVKTWFEILTILTVALVFLSNGLFFYWTSPFILKIVEDKVNYNITEEEASYLILFRSLPLVFLTPFLVPITNKLGKKKLLLATSGPYGVAWLIKAFSTNLWLLYLARIAAGISDAITYCAAMAYVGEIATPEVRGVWGNSLIMFVMLGQLIINFLADYFTVQVTSLICLPIPILFFIIFYFMPETPHFYVLRENYEEAKESLRRLRRKYDVTDEFINIRNCIAKQKMGTWNDLVADRTNRKALMICVFLAFSQMFSGIWTFEAYMQFIFEKSGTNISPETSTYIYSILNVLLYSIAAYCSNRLGRRKSLIISFVLTGLSLCAESIYFIIETNCPNVDLRSFQWVPLAGMLTFLVVSSFGVRIVPLLMPGELFAVNVKNYGLALFCVLFGLSGFIVNLIFYYLNTYTGLAGPFMLFGVSCFISAVVSHFIIPETKNKSLEKIQEILRNS